MGISLDESDYDGESAHARRDGVHLLAQSGPSRF